jgi:aminomethyltransferase
MAVGTPFHPRTESLCHSYDWKQWSGYLTVASYNDFVQPEYAAIRNAAALIDISPLYKYFVSGRDAASLLNHVITHDAAKMAHDQVIYTPWCDPDGAVRQEGTVFRMGEDRYMVAAAEPAYEWIRSNSTGFDVEMVDRSTDMAALSLQGPHAREILKHVAGDALGELRFFRIAEARIGAAEVMISRTGYTGDLGYEIWIPRQHALAVWDALVEGGAAWQITPCGMTAMDISRVEAGFILIGVDYTSAELAHVADDRVTPYELGLGWAVKPDKGNFIGRKALASATSPRRKVVGLEIDWQPLEEAFMAADLMPDLPMTVCRESVPLYAMDGMQAGRASSRVWSKLLKKYLAIATLDAEQAKLGNQVEMEVTVRYSRTRVPATVVNPGFFRPERMRA